ncbi:MAG: carbohydrate binding family 9 domain-containing protein [Acidobacteria bacterium]|nr:carbohydrate binding family 9 domain-containing protein [Acidobacteriota bacterium]
MKSAHWCATVALALVVANTAFSGSINYETARLERRLKAVKTPEKIVLDGSLSEAAWSLAPAASGFTQNEPQEDQPATEQTEVRVLYDNDNLYVGIYAHDSEPQRVIISDLKKDFSQDTGDTFKIALDTFHDERNAYLFSINPSGARWDAQMINEGREVNVNWDGVWHVETRMVEDGWTAEVMIPFKTLKFRETDVQSWGLNFERNLRRKNEDSLWSPVPRIFNVQRVSLAGTLEDLEGIKPGANFRIKPYVVTSFAQDGVGSRRCSPYLGSSDGKRLCNTDAGVDAKYGLTTGLTWDFTYNTDFSQVEADEQQINLTRFSLFFPEKREFFLENSGIFAFGVATDRNAPTGAGGSTSPVPGGGGGRQGANISDMIPFFSRRIGLSDDGSPIPILGGTRLSGRAGRYEMGFLNIQQKELGAVNATNFTVARVRKNILANSDAGMILVNKEVMDSSHFNRVVGGDANFRIGRSLNINSYLAKSFTPGISGDDLAARGSAVYKDNVWDLRSSVTSIDDHFIDEMGFVPRLGIQKYSGYFGRTFRPKSVQRTVRSLSPHAQIDYVVGPDGGLETRYIDYHFPISFQNSSFVEVGINPTLERFTKPFLINRSKDIVIPPGTYSFDEYFFMGRTDSSSRLSLGARWAKGRFYTGDKTTYGAGGTFRFNYKLKMSVGLLQNRIALPQGRFNTNLFTGRADYSFSTNMFLNALIQYNSDTHQWSSNIRFNLIHRPLSDLFVVYNERRDSMTGGMVDRAIITKFTYMIAR